ncbi:MAG TPA: peptidylprolyl isomerase [bacterium]|nr:peptidylprolyl isomerase [bacterium]
MSRHRLFLALFALFALIACGENDPQPATQNDIDNGAASDADTVATDDLLSDETADEDILVTTDETGDELLSDADVPPAVTREVVLETTMGEITIGLYGDAMPITSANFESYVEEDFFTGLTFHRVIPGFVAQGGGYDKDFVEKETHDPIIFERNPAVDHVKYAISMARTNDIDSATSQFFITFEAQPRLDYNSDADFLSTQKFPCAAFGIVTAGFDVVDAMGEVETGTQSTPLGDLEDVPVTPIIITKSYFAE